MQRVLIAAVVAVLFARSAGAGLESLAPKPTPTPAASPSVGPAFDALMPAYDASRAALSADRLADLAQPARELRRQLATLGEGLTAEAAGVPAAKLGELRALLPALRKSAETLVTASTLPAARDAFGALSKSLVAWRQLAGKGPDVAYCPMASHQWLQPPETDIENPYLGKSMAGCGARRG